MAEISPGEVSKERILARFRRDGRNSSHFVWLLADLTFFEASNGWIFAFRELGSVTLIALEPLMEGAPAAGDFELAWSEFVHARRPKICAFVGIYQEFARLLESNGFQTLKIGEEPWVELGQGVAQGNAGKGVRSARNQAIRSGLSVEEWKSSEIDASPGKRELLAKIYSEWRDGRLIDVSGFLNATDPVAYISDRRYFVLRSQHRMEAYLIATPVPGIQGYFLEDLVTRTGCPRGGGELLTLEALASLGDGGAKDASLGVVSVMTLDYAGAKKLPRGVSTLLRAFTRLQRVPGFPYRFEGLEVYRKRFKPKAWQAIYLGVKRVDRAETGSAAWLQVVISLIRAFAPRPRLTSHGLWMRIAGPLKRYPLTSAVALVSFAFFALLNRFGELPAWALAKYGFGASVPFREWVARSLVSDCLYLNATHFWSTAIPFFLVLGWTERKHKPGFVVPLFFSIMLFDDWLDYLILIRPIGNHLLLEKLISHKDVGSSLILSTFLGVQICQFRKAREPIFATMILGMMVYLVIAASWEPSGEQFKHLVMNLDHAVFLIIGYLIGKARFGFLKRRNELASKGRTPLIKPA